MTVRQRLREPSPPAAPRGAGRRTGRHPLAGAVLLALVGAVARCSAADPGAAPTGVRPARTSRPAAAATRPAEELAAPCATQADKLRSQLDDRFAVAAFPPFVVAGNMSDARLRQYADGSIVRPAKAMWASYFQVRPDKPITILLFVDANSYAHWAGVLFNDAQVPHFGYYKPSLRTMVMNISTGTGTLVHELTHALIAFDLPKVPDWFNEGLASLHEQCSVGEDRITGLVNWRLPALQQAIRAGTLRSLEDLITAGDFYGPRQGLNYAQARYFCMYMQHRGVLKAFYGLLRKDPSDAQAAVAAVEKLLGKKIDQVDKDLADWVRTLRFPPR